MNQKSTIIIAVAVVVVLAAAGAGAFFLMKDKDKDNDETYWYYLYFGDANAKNGWYSAKADNASDGFINAMKDANYEWKQSKLGYVATIDGVGTSWKIFNYVYSHTDKTAQDASTSFLNGWASYSGYTTEEHDGFKLFQSNAKIWFLTPYKEDSSFEDPSTVSTWKNAGPFEKDIFDDGKKTFWFYLYFAEGNAKNGWYSAKASNASDAFTDAMKDANIEWKQSSWGYIGSIDGNAGEAGDGWSLMCYVYSQTDKAAQDASATTSGFVLKGWLSYYGYDTEKADEFKLYQSSATIWFMAPYTADYVSTPDPSTASTWKATGPFDA